MLRFFHTEDPYAAAAETIEITFWQDRDYILYWLFDINGRLRGYRFEVCCDAQFSNDSVERLDLGLHLRVDMVGKAQFSGEDTVKEYEANGLLSPVHQNVLRNARKVLDKNYRTIIQQAEGL